jgi:VWFA-related protein
MDVRRSLLVFVVLFAASAAFSQPTPARQPAASSASASGGASSGSGASSASGASFASGAAADESSGGPIDLNVVVTGKSGSPVSGLQQQDFTIVDNKMPQKITSFRALDGTQTPIEATIVIDAVNADVRHISYERDQIDRFLRADEGELTYPTSIFVATDAGLQDVTDFSKDGNKLSAALDKYTIGFRFVPRSAGFYGAADRFQISLDVLHELARREAPLPGRKIMLWMSPGWPLLSGPEVQIDDKEEQQLFADVVSLSTDLRREGITLYSIDPAGAMDSLDRDTYWQNFVKGVSKPRDVQAGDLGLQVLAVQSGGVVFSFNNDLTSLLQRCLADTRASYEIAFEPPAGTRPNEYHHLEVRIAKHGLKARTWQGYYSGAESQFREPAMPPPAGGGFRGAGLR